MLCHSCGSDTRVEDSRSYTETVRRKRRCVACGKRFFTKEVPCDKYGNATIMLVDREDAVRFVKTLMLRGVDKDVVADVRNFLGMWG